jgi:class 3 adenylate cyclase
MVVVSKFESRRARGIVWVCDIASSSKHLNNNQSAEALEIFLQRFLFLSMIFVEAAGGTFIKWTGDGFLAWFETPLHREVGDAAFQVFNAAWSLTFYVNVSQLSVESMVKFKIRHAVTLEHDALVIDLAYSDKSATDVLGRAVVLAFRLSSIKAEFPGIVTHRELLKLVKDTGTINFKKLKMSKDDRLKYFKDETWGTSDIFVSGGRAQHSVGLKTLIMRTKELIENVESGNLNAKRRDFVTKVVMEMANGPEWCGEVRKALDDFCKESLLGSLKQIIPILEEKIAASNTSPK